MLNINITSRLSTVVIGLLIFFVPFFTYLSPDNLRQLDKLDILELLLSSIVILIVISLSSFSVEMLIKRFFKKKIILFPLFCFAFYLQFFYMPILEPLQKVLYPKFGFIGVPVLIFFELFCLIILVFGVKFNVLALRIILIFSSLMLLITFIPLVGYLAENIGKNQVILNEVKSSHYSKDMIIKNRNVYFIILDEMIDIETAERFKIATKKEVTGILSSAGLKYINKSHSTYGTTEHTMTTLMLLDYFSKFDELKNYHISNFYPKIMYSMKIEVPLLTYLKKANSDFYWTGKSYGSCIPSSDWVCINLMKNFLMKNLLNFSSTTPLPKILRRILKINPNQDSISPFLEYIDKNGIPKSPFFAFIHHNSPHEPFRVSSECEPFNFPKQSPEGYKAAYHCALKNLQIFMEKINNLDPDAIVIFQADHGLSFSTTSIELPNNEEHQLRGKIFNAIKAPKTCFDKYGLPQTSINSMRFALNCAYGFKLPFRKNIHYEIQGLDVAVERKIFD